MKVLIRTWCKALGVLLVIMAITTFGRASKAPAEAHRAYRPYGTALELMAARDQVVMLSGPAGTGKSRAELEKLHIAAMKYEGMRGIIIRKTRKSITQSAMVTYEQKVLPLARR
jgi:tRNA A37 threonylcarbamoyladenosine biosynthesis protein TsaE